MPKSKRKLTCIKSSSILKKGIHINTNLPQREASAEAYERQKSAEPVKEKRPAGGSISCGSITLNFKG